MTEVNRTPYLLIGSGAMLGPGKSGGVGMAHGPLSLDGLGGVATGTIGCDETSDGDMRLIAGS